MSDLPEGWAEAPLSLLRKPKSDAFNPSKWDGGKLELYSVPSHASGEPEIIDAKEIGSNKQFVSPGDVLVSKINPRLNRTWVVRPRGRYEQIASTEWVVFPRQEEIDSVFLAHFLSTYKVRDFLAANASGVGGSLMRVRPGTFDRLRVPLPPLNEQRRIVAKIEALFSRLEEGVSALKQARARLALYRQSLLKAAFEGRLTEAWRRENPHLIEPPETLLARIRTEREAAYQQALADWQEAVKRWLAEGGKGRKPRKPGKPSDSSFSASTNESGWVVLNLGSLIGEVQQGWSPKCDDNACVGADDWAIVKTTAVQPGLYDDTAIKQLPKTLDLRPEIEIRVGDFLMTRKGPKVRTGVVCLVKRTRRRIMLCDTVYRFRAFDKIVSPTFLEHFLNSPNAVREIDRRKSGISDSGISLNHGKIKSLPVPLCSPAEQAEIVRILEERLSRAVALEAEIDAALARADALRQGDPEASLLRPPRPPGPGRRARHHPSRPPPR